MAAQVLPMFDARLEGQEDWTARCVAVLSNMLGDILKGLSMYKISDISSALFSRKGDLFGQMMLAFIQKCHGALIEQEHCTCPQCKRECSKDGECTRDPWKPWQEPSNWSAPTSTVPAVPLASALWMRL
jgi:hypothetical protein